MEGVFLPSNFTVAEGETIGIDAGVTSPAGPNFNVTWRLLTGAGGPAFRCGSFNTGLVDCGPLPTAGNPYQIETRDWSSNDTGTYQVPLQRETAADACEVTRIPCDGVVTSTIDNPVENDILRFNFDVAEGEFVAINAARVSPSGINFNVVWRLLTAAGTAAVDCAGFNNG